MKKIIAIVVTIITLSMSVMLIIGPKKEFSYNENRFLAKFPKISVSNILSGKFMSQLETYISDNFPLRENLLGVKSRTYKTLGVYKQSDVYYGIDNKLYQEYKKPINSERIVRRINKFKDKVDSKVYFMLAPTSIYINNNKISKYNNSYDEGKTIDYYKENLSVNFIDIRSSLNSNKDDYLYYGTDHHWTTRGANVAYIDFCNSVGLVPNKYTYSKVNDKFYGTLYSKLLDNSLKHDYIEIINDNTNYKVYYDDTKITINSLYSYKYLNEKDKYSFFLDNNHSLIKIENLDIQNDDSILIIKDSYANSFIPFIGPHYKNIYVIDPRYYNLSISEFVTENNIKNILFIYNVLTIDDDLGIVSVR